jgi:hypothetical protein
MIEEFKLKEQVIDEAYQYFDKNIRNLEKGSDGKVTPTGSGLVDNDTDAFRHAYASGVFTMEYGKKKAKKMGDAWEILRIPSSGSGTDTEMDLWNNSIGRKYGAATKSRTELAELLKNALEKGELITTIDDPRSYKMSQDIAYDPEKPIIVIQENKTGRNKVFLDLSNGNVMNRKKFISLIEQGQYPGYQINRINSIPTPVSKKDNTPLNNLD